MSKEKQNDDEIIYTLDGEDSIIDYEAEGKKLKEKDKKNNNK